MNSSRSMFGNASNLQKMLEQLQKIKMFKMKKLKSHISLCMKTDKQKNNQVEMAKTISGLQDQLHAIRNQIKESRKPPREAKRDEDRAAKARNYCDKMSIKRQIWICCPIVYEKVYIPGRSGASIKHRLKPPKGRLKLWQDGIQRTIPQMMS